ncbi:hypothetical protein ScPMuIL_004363 [Solemya velum]
MDEEAVLECRTGEKEWKCPIKECNAVLSRKQTLKTHILHVHNIQAGCPPKRYKLYETEETVPVPKRTMYRKRTLTDMCLNHSENTCNSDSTSSDNLPTPINEKPTTFEDQLLSLPVLEQASDPDETEVFDNYSEQPMDLVDISSDEDAEYDCEWNPHDLQTQDESTSNNDPPIYVIPPRDTLYQSPISKTEYQLVAGAFISKYNMSATMAEDLLQFAQLLIPEENISETSFARLQRSCGFDANYLKYHLYCELCKKLFDLESEDESCKTPECKGSKPDNCSYFVTGSLDIQFREIFEREGVWESIEEMKQTCTLSNTIADITNGESYKKLLEPGGFLDGTSNITLSMFIDGIPLYSSSSVSLWPVYFLINEIPPQKRFRKKNMLLWGVWQGRGKPNMNMFLRPLVIDLHNLYTNGILTSVKCDNQLKEIIVRAQMIIATMDLQARAYVTNMTQHNGEFGCLYCMESGKVVPSGKAYCRVYLPREQMPCIRTYDAARESATKSRQTGTRIEGFLGESVLWHLPYFSMVNGIVIDYMHGILLGITKKFLDYWFHSKFSCQPFNISRTISDIDNILKQIRPLYVIHRKPRILTNTYQHWKASELRNWLLFYSLPCLKDHLPGVYLTHFSCLVEATYLLLTTGLSSEDLQRAELLLNKFVENVQTLYGENAMSLNVHNLTHLVYFVRQWGPLWAWSCFSFESFNGEIKKSVHGTGNVCKQIFWALQAQKRVESRSCHAKSGKVQDFLKRLQDSRGENVNADSEAYQCSVIKSSKAQVKLNDDIKGSLKFYANTDDDLDFISISKIAKHGFQMFSKGCTKVRKQNSYTIKLNNVVEGLEGNGDIIEVASYVMEKRSKKVFAIGQLMTSTGSILPRRVPHLQKIENVGPKVNTVVPTDIFREPLMVIQGRADVYAALLPNNNERD